MQIQSIGSPFSPTLEEVKKLDEPSTKVKKKSNTWTPWDIEKLEEGVKLYGSNWRKIAEYVGNFTNKQCAERWKSIQNPNLNRLPLNDEELNRLKDAQQKYGNQWAWMAKEIFKDQRSANFLKNTWNAKLKKRVKQASPPLSPDSPLPLKERRMTRSLLKAKTQQNKISLSLDETKENNSPDLSHSFTLNQQPPSSFPPPLPLPSEQVFSSQINLINEKQPLVSKKEEKKQKLDLTFLFQSFYDPTAIPSSIPSPLPIQPTSRFLFPTSPPPVAASTWAKFQEEFWET